MVELENPPTKYFNGEIEMSVQDLPGPSGDWFGYQRSYNNALQSNFDGLNGFNWLPVQLPYVVPDVSNNGNLVVMAAPNEAVTFVYNSGSGTYSPQFVADGVRVTLAADSGNSQLVYTQSASGRQVVIRFWDFSQGPTAGHLVKYVEPSGLVTQATSYNDDGNVTELQRSYTSGGSTIIYSLLFTYDTSADSHVSRITNVKMRSSPNGTTWTTIRQVAYTYYPASDSNGNLNDLKYAVIEDASASAIDTYYYRYYTSNTSPGYQHGIKFAVNPSL